MRLYDEFLYSAENGAECKISLDSGSDHLRVYYSYPVGDATRKKYISFYVTPEYTGEASLEEFVALVKGCFTDPEVIDAEELLKDELLQSYFQKKPPAEVSPELQKKRELKLELLRHAGKEFENDEIFQSFQSMESRCIYAATWYKHTCIQRGFFSHQRAFRFDRTEYKLYEVLSEDMLWVLGLSAIPGLQKKYSFFGSYIVLRKEQSASPALLQLVSALQEVGYIKLLRVVDDDPDETYKSCYCIFEDLMAKEEDEKLYGLYHTYGYYSLDTDFYSIGSICPLKAPASK